MSQTTLGERAEKTEADGDSCCGAVYVQYTGMRSREPGKKYSHRCQLPTGHEGDHCAPAAHRKWAQGVTEHHCV